MVVAVGQQQDEVGHSGRLALGLQPCGCGLVAVSAVGHGEEERSQVRVVVAEVGDATHLEVVFGGLHCGQIFFNEE